MNTAIHNLLNPNLRLRFCEGGALRFVVAGALLWISVIAYAAAAAQTDIPGPNGSGKFGTSVNVLPNGNIIVTDPDYDASGPVPKVGAVHLCTSAGVLISTLTGSAPNDQIGVRGVVILTNGNYVVLSPNWDNGAVTDA